MEIEAKMFNVSFVQFSASGAISLTTEENSEVIAFMTVYESMETVFTFQYHKQSLSLLTLLGSCSMRVG